MTTEMSRLQPSFSPSDLNEATSLLPTNGSATRSYTPLIHDDDPLDNEEEEGNGIEFGLQSK